MSRRTNWTASLLMLTATSGWAACADVADPPEEIDQNDLDERSDPVLSGTNTTSRPAIGQVCGNGQCCTATLISSRVILTAAHCFNFNQNFSFLGNANTAPSFPASVNPGYTFTVNNPATNPSTVSRAVRRFANASGALGAADIAVAELDSEINSTTAPALQLATTEPANNSTVTVWGYGCTAGQPNGMGGWMNQVWPNSKTTRTLTWDSNNNRTTTNATCSGDSGGPYLDGSGRIFALHSTGGGDGRPPRAPAYTPGPDVTADTVLYWPFINRMNAIYGKRQVCTACPVVTLRTWNRSNLVQAVDGDNLGGIVNARGTAVGSWERFRWVQFAELGPDQGVQPYVALQTTSGRWVSAVNGGGSTVESGTNYLGANETFRHGTRAGGVTFRTLARSKYLVAENGGGGDLNANRDAAQDWETFFVQ